MTDPSSQSSEQDVGTPVFEADVMEGRRPEVLRRYDISEGRSEEIFGRMTRLATDLFDVEAAFVAFLNSDRQWLRERVGFDQAESRFAAACCTMALKEDGLFVIENAEEDSDTSLRAREAGLGFYAGVPLRTPEEETIGIFSIMDPEPQSFANTQRGQLEDVGQMVSEKLDRRRHVHKHERLAQKQKEMSRRFEAILQDPNMMVGVLGTDGTLLETNETSLRYIEAGRDEVVGEPFWETPWWDEKDRENVREWIERAAEGEYVEYKAGSVDTEGRSYWVEGTIRPVTRKGEGGDEQIEVLVVSARDVTERERSRKKLENYREYTDRLLDDVDDLFFALDEEGQPQRWNQRVSEVTGYSKEEIGEMNAFDFVPEGEQERVAATIKGALADDSVQIEVPLLRKDGTTVFYEFVGSSLEHPEGGREVVGIGRDVSERKEREHRLRQAEVLFQNAQDAFFLLDVREEGEEKMFAYRRVNPAYEKKFGRSVEEVRGHSPRDVFGEELGQFMEGKCRKCARRREPLEYEEEIPLEGEMTSWITRIAPVLVEGEVQQIVGHATNITARKRRERKLREQGRRLEQIRRNVTDVVWMSPPDKSEIEFVSEAYETIWGRSTEELRKHPGSFVEGIHPEDRGRVQSAQEIQKQNPDAYDEIYRVVRPEGEVRWVRDRSTGVYDEDGRLEHIIGVATDITERKEQERALRERQEKIEALYEATRRLLTAEGPKDVSTRIHELVEDIFDYPLRNTGFVDGESIVPERTTAEHSLGVSTPKRRPKDGNSLSARALQAGNTVVVEDVRSLDNEIEYGEIRTAAAVPIGDRGVVVLGKTEVEAFDPFNLRLIGVLSGYASLVLNRLDRESDLREAKEEAEEASEMKSALLANMSHEIRTPLTSIIGFAEAAGTEASEIDLPTSSPLPDYANLIEQGGKRLLDTLEGVLNLSKLEAEQMEFDAESVPLATEVQRAVEELGPKAQEKEIDLRLETESARAEADEGGVQIVVRNLLSNAIKYTEAGGTVWVRTYQEEEGAVLEVEDTGIGMEPEVIEDLFEPFRQASEGFGREYEGTGGGWR